MIKKYLMLCLIFFVVTFIYPYTINAEECPSTELAKLKASANAAEIKYDYIKDYSQYEGRVDDLNIYNLFNISINNLTDKFFAIIYGKDIVYFYDASAEVPNTITKGFFEGGVQYTFDFIANTKDACNGELLNTKTITLPSFNKYSLDPLCKGIEDYRLCNMWYAGNIRRDEFVTRVTEYKNSLKNKDSDNTLLPQNEWDIIMDWLINNYNIILISIIVAGSSIIIIIKINEKRKNVL
jgi:hypothetical protein